MLPASGFLTANPRRSPAPGEPDEPARPGRRAFVLAVVGFAIGAPLGFWAAGRKPVVAAASEPEDPLVAWTRELARDPTRTAQLKEHYHGLFYAIEKVPDDPILWHGVRNLTELLETTPPDVAARALARALLQTLQVHRPALADLDTLQSRLRRLGDGR